MSERKRRSSTAKPAHRGKRTATDERETVRWLLPYLLLMRRALTFTVLALALAGCGGDENGEEAQAPEESPRQTITITETDFALEPSSVELEAPGTYAFEVVNDGQVAHALEVEGEGIEEETETLEPGQRETLTVDLDSGSYELYCPVGDHKERGMTGTLDVKASGSGY
jgi:plastocyanin